MKQNKMLSGNTLVLVLFEAMLCGGLGCEDATVPPREQSTSQVSSCRSTDKGPGARKLASRCSGQPQPPVRPAPGTGITDGVYRNLLECGAYESGTRARDRIRVIEYVPSVRQRDEQIRALVSTLGRLKTPSRIQVLVLDAFGDTRFNGYDWQILYMAEGISDKEAKCLSDIRCKRIDVQTWEKMLPPVQELVGNTGTDRSSRLFHDVAEIILVSCYDGRRWRIKPWFLMAEALCQRAPEEADFAFFSLMGVLTWELTPPVCVAGNGIPDYGAHPLTFEDTRKAVRAVTARGGDWRNWRARN